MTVKTSCFFRTPKLFEADCKLPRRVAKLGTRALLLALAVPSLSHGAISGDFTYTATETTITITGYTSGPDTDVVIPDTIETKPVTAIGMQAFFFKTDVTSIQIPTTVTSIGAYAFYGCSSLSNVTLPSTMETLGIGVFYSCTALASIDIPTGISGIPDFAFYNCGDLASVTIPSNVATIGQSAFSNCTGMTSLTVVPGVTGIEKNAFVQCSSLTNVVLPDSVASLGDSVFVNCSDLISLTLPAGLTTIPFGLCDGCAVLESITIPSGVTSIEAKAFKACDALVDVTIPSLVTFIGERAFNGASALDHAVFLGNAPTMETGVFDSTTPGFDIRFAPGATGYTAPLWYDYPTSELVVTSPVHNWLVSHSLPTDSDMLSDDNLDGVSLLMAYALNLDPTEMLAGSMPQVVRAGSGLSMSFYAGSAGVTYAVEQSSNLSNWTTTGVTLTEPDDEQLVIATTTEPLSATTLFLRLVVLPE